MTPLEKSRILKDNIFLDMERYMEEGFTVTEIAAVYASQAMFLYRQMFDDRDYEMMMQGIYDNRNNVRKINIEDLFR